MAEEKISSQQILKNLKDEDPVCRNLLTDVLAEERKVMYNKRRPRIHETLYNTVKAIVR